MKAFFKIIFLSIILMLGINTAKSQTNVDTSHVEDKAFTKVEVEASFPGGNIAWAKYITKYIQSNISRFKRRDIGTCVIRFIVDTHGRTSDVEATNMKKSTLAKVAIEAIENGPKWIPAQQDGKPVNAYRLQPVTITDPGK